MTVKVKNGYVQIGDGKIYYETAGDESNKTLILAHAGFVDSGMWDSQWNVFAEQYHVIRYDLLGYGKSDVAAGPVSRRAELLSLMDALHVERAILLGCSMSGATIIDLALEQPEKVAALIIVSAMPNGFDMQGPPPAKLMDMIGAIQQGDLARASELQIQIWVDGESRGPDQVDSAVREQAAAMNRIAVNNNTWMVADMQPLNPLDPPAAGRLDTLNLPTLVIVGALDHGEILRAADVTATGIKGAQKIIIPDSAHVPNMERPDEFNAAVLAFLSTVTRG